MLREHVGDAPGLLDAELGKLAIYVGERVEITAADIAALTGRHREEKVFAVTDAMSSGDTQTALRQWEQVLATDRAAPARAIAGERVINPITASVPALKEVMALMPRAAPALPCLVSWNPSTAVITEADSPGMLRRIEVVDPPYMAP